MGGGCSQEDVQKAVDKAQASLTDQQKAQLAQLLKHIDDLKSEKSELYKKYEELQKDFNKVSSSGASSGKEAVMLKEDVLKKDERLRNLESDFKDKTRVASERDAELAKVSAEFEAEKEAHRNTHKQRDALHAECNSQRVKIESLDKANNDLQVKFQNVEKVNGKLETELANEKKTLESLRESKANLDKDHSALSTEAASLRGHKARLEQSVTDMTQKLQALENEKKNIEKDQALQRQEITALKEQLATAVTSLEATKCDLSKVTQDRDTQKDAFMKQQNDMNKTTRADKQQASKENTKTLELFTKGHSEASERLQKAHNAGMGVLMKQIDKERETNAKAMQTVTDTNDKMMSFFDKWMERSPSQMSLEGSSRPKAIEMSPGTQPNYHPGMQSPQHHPQYYPQPGMGSYYNPQNYYPHPGMGQHPHPQNVYQHPGMVPQPNTHNDTLHPRMQTPYGYQTGTEKQPHAESRNSATEQESHTNQQ